MIGKLDLSNMLTIGIAGGTGSGKTTIVRNIMDAAPADSVSILEQDSYYIDLRGVPMEERERTNFDHPDSFDSHLLRNHVRLLQKGVPVEKPVYDFVEHTRTNLTERIEPRPILVIEGILIFVAPQLRELMDIKVFIDTDADLRLIRRIQRDMSDRGRTLDSVIHQYETTVRPMHFDFVEPSKRFADIIIPEGGHNLIAQELLIDRIKGQLNHDNGAD
jgi:uridine kinase